MANPATGPRFRLAPGVALLGGRRPPSPSADPARSAVVQQASPPSQPSPVSEPPPGFRNTTWDRAALAVSIDPVWLLAPLFVRDAAGLTASGAGPGPVWPSIARVSVGGADLPATSAGWPDWWTAALAYRPGTPAPRVEDLVADSPPLRHLWTMLADDFRDWLASRPARPGGSDAASRAVERQALTDFAQVNGRAPGRWTVRILEIPVTGTYLHSPAPRRLVVSAALRADPETYAAALAAELPDHF